MNSPLDIEREIRSAVNETVGDFWREFAEDAPDEMRDLMGSSPADRGEPPGVRSGSLAASLNAELAANGVELSMNDYAEHLDPLFGEGETHPFIEKGADNVLVKMKRT